MSYRKQRRQDVFVDLLIRTIDCMEKDVVRMVGEFAISGVILYLVFEGEVMGFVGVGCVTIITTLDLRMLYKAYNRAKIEQRREYEDSP